MRLFIVLSVFFILAPLADARGKYKNPYPVLKCDGDPSYTYSVILPSTYEKYPNKKFPTLFISSPSGKPTPMGLTNWAERHQVIVILNATTKNGKENDYTHALKVLMDTVEAKYRIHPFLRFSTGCSGGGEISAYLAVEFPKKWSGVVMQAHSGNGRYPPKHCAVAFLSGDADKVHPIEAVRSAYEMLKRQGNPVHITAYKGKGHGVAPVEDVERELTWMLNLKRRTHPAINGKYIKEVVKELDDEIKVVLAIKDELKRRGDVERLLDTPYIEKAKSYKSLVGEKVKLQLRLADKESDPVRVWALLTDITYTNFLRYATKDERDKILSRIRELEKDKSVLKEKSPMATFYRLYKQQQKYSASSKRSKKLRDTILRGYEELIRRHPDSMGAKRAAKANSELED